LIENLSKGGVFIKTSGTFSVGQEISLFFGKENMDGTIIRVEPQGIGVKFGKP
jgi:Tfp pilus assembly protein PilZ